MNIRASTKDDLALIRSVHEDAFGLPEGEAIAQLACRLLMDETAKPLISLVAEVNEKIIANIIFTSVKVDRYKGEAIYILCPLAVSKHCQQKGLGTKLINHGLEILKTSGADIILVLGDPSYYSRLGFKADHNIKAPYELAYPETWQALELKVGALDKIDGVAKCSVSLSQPEHW